MSALIDAQKKFSLMLAALILEADRQGFGVTMGEAYRSPEEARRLAVAGKGIAESLHCKRLAVDLCLWRGPRLLTLSEEYEALGVWWEGQGGAWGGRFKRADGNHFSLAFGGFK